MSDPAAEFQALFRAARVASIESRLLFEWLQAELVAPSEAGWDEQALETVRRVRRLHDLGLNPEGIEVALHMREEILRLRSEVETLQRRLGELQRSYERELARLLREIAFEGDWST